jgi:hypothetical protein
MNGDLSNTGPTGRSFDPSGPTGDSPGGTGGIDPSGHHHDPQVPPVNFDSLLGGLDRLFLFGSGGQAGGGQEQWGGLFSTIIQGLNHELINIVGPGVGLWAPDGNSGLGVGGQPDFSDRSGSVGGLDQGNNRHQYNPLAPHH